MRGNPVSGGLAYSPAEYSDRVNPNDVAEWVNVDSVATHTATEEHGLWDVEVEPGESAQRVLVAGTHRFVCRFHPEMRGAFGVTPFVYAEVRPVQKTKRVRIPRRKRKGQRRYKKVTRTVFKRKLRAQWGPSSPEHPFDVQRRRAGQDWLGWRVATSAGSGGFRVGSGEDWEIRVRQRAADDPARTTDWSPPATITIP